MQGFVVKVSKSSRSVDLDLSSVFCSLSAAWLWANSLRFGSSFMKLGIIIFCFRDCCKHSVLGHVSEKHFIVQLSSPNTWCQEPKAQGGMKHGLCAQGLTRT